MVNKRYPATSRQRWRRRNVAPGMHNIQPSGRGPGSNRNLGRRGEEGGGGRGRKGEGGLERARARTHTHTHTQAQTLTYRRTGGRE